MNSSTYVNELPTHQVHWQCNFFPLFAIWLANWWTSSPVKISLKKTTFRLRVQSRDQAFSFSIQQWHLYALECKWNVQTNKNNSTNERCNWTDELRTLFFTIVNSTWLCCNVFLLCFLPICWQQSGTDRATRPSQRTNRVDWNRVGECRLQLCPHQGSTALHKVATKQQLWTARLRCVRRLDSSYDQTIFFYQNSFL